jgi:predicted RNA-binding Zn-ribbon protein involved in translation (DUF1610 family)
MDEEEEETLEPDATATKVDITPEMAKVAAEAGVCPSCGEPVQKGWPRCKSCDQRLTAIGAPTVPAPAPKPVVTQAAPPKVMPPPSPPKPVVAAPPPKTAPAPAGGPTKCPKCGEEVEPDWAKCPDCGTSLKAGAPAAPPKAAAKAAKCPKCGEEVEPEWTKCPFCSSML